MWLAALSSVSLVFWCGRTVLWRNPLALKNNNNNNNKRKQLIKPIEGSAVLVGCEEL